MSTAIKARNEGESLVTPLALTIRDAARATSTSTPTIWRAIAAGDLPAVRINKSATRILVTDLENWLESRRERRG